jgi:hypothetical protein
MPSALFSTPRPEPNLVLPAVGGTLIVALALPVFLVAGWPLAGWALAAVLWVAVHTVDLFLARARRETGSVAASGVQVLGLFLKSIGLLAVLFAAVASDPGLALAAAVTYALAYTLELGLSLVFYFGAGATR